MPVGLHLSGRRAGSVDRSPGPVPPLSPLVVPFVPGMLHPETLEAVWRPWWQLRLRAIDPADHYAYARLFLEYWEVGTGFAINEQDVVPGQLQLEELLDCPELWCSVPYACGAGVMSPFLGCAKFAGDLCRADRDLFRRYFTFRYGVDRFPHWRVLNEIVTTVLQHEKVSCHVHHPAARHLHEYGPEAR